MCINHYKSYIYIERERVCVCVIVWHVSHLCNWWTKHDCEPHTKWMHVQVMDWMTIIHFSGRLTTESAIRVMSRQYPTLPTISVQPTMSNTNGPTYQLLNIQISTRRATSTCTALSIKERLGSNTNRDASFHPRAWVRFGSWFHC
jgi:hypothetical protein